MLALLIAVAISVAPPLPAANSAPTSFVWPARGTITAPFGDGRGHPGIDIGILRSLAVSAAAPGRVIRVGRPRGFEGYGNIVQVNVGGGYTTLYAHLARWSVRKGEQVWAGERIGTAGCTGWCTGTHLHFEVRYLGIPVDPLRFRLSYTAPDPGG